MRSHTYAGAGAHVCTVLTYQQLDAAGIRPLSSAKRLQKEAYRAWFTGLTLNAIAGLYTLWQLRQREQNIDKSDGEGVVESKKLARCVSSYLCLDEGLTRNTGSERPPICNYCPMSAI